MEGAVERFFDLLQTPKIAHSARLAHSILEVCAGMCKRTDHTQFYNAMSKVGAVGVVQELVRFHAQTGFTKLFHAAALVPHVFAMKI